MSPRKSSTSSGKLPSRPRYLGIEVAGVLPASPRILERELADLLARGPGDRTGVRVIRLEGRKVLAEVDRLYARVARERWSAGAGGDRRFVTRRTWGTLRKAKAWIRARPQSP